MNDKIQCYPNNPTSQTSVKIVVDNDTKTQYSTVDYVAEQTGVTVDVIMKENCVVFLHDYYLLTSADAVQLMIKYAVERDNYKSALSYLRSLCQAFSTELVEVDSLDAKKAMRLCVTAYSGELAKRKKQKEKARQEAKIKKDKKNHNESYVQRELQKKWGGKIEVTTQYGRIDLLTEDKIVEVKHTKGWKGAVGQILTYGKCFPDHQKVICLFGHSSEGRISDIKHVLAELNISLEIFKENPELNQG